jgi:hypothetical protein
VNPRLPGRYSGPLGPAEERSSVNRNFRGIGVPKPELGDQKGEEITMGLRGLMSGLGMNVFAIAGLMVFFALFVTIVAWTWTRPQREMDYQSRLPLEDKN